MKAGLVAVGSFLLVIGAVVIISNSNLVPSLTSYVGQISTRGIATAPTQVGQLFLLGQKLLPLLAIGGAVCLGYGVRANA